MRTINITDCTKGIRIGYRQENDYDVVVYSYPADWDGEVQVYFRPPRSKQSYPVSGFSQDYDAGTITWTASAADLANAGTGALEYMMLNTDGVVAKSKVFEVIVAADIISAATDAPDEWESWVDTLAQLGAVVTGQARDAALSAAAASSSAWQAASSQAAAARSEQAAAASAAAAEVSETHAAESAESAAESAEQAAQHATAAGFTFFDIDDSDGHMYVTVTPNLVGHVDFSIDENRGILEVVVNG